MKMDTWAPMVAPILVFGGPYSNRHAMEALIAYAQALGIPPARCLCTGDAVAYGADPAETVAALRGFGCAVVAGNVERQLGAGAEDCGCGFDPGTACDLASGAWYAHAAARISADDRAWMADLPDAILLEVSGRRCVALHGGAQDVARFLWPSSPDMDFAHEIELLEAQTGPIDAIFAGHSGIAFARDIPLAGRSVRWINAGVIGMPPQDGRPETRFAVVDADGHAVFHRLHYDHKAAAEAMRAADLTQGYEISLETGLWPAEDILPPEMRSPQ